MKHVSKPISSPSRLDKFPPPLMRFLRNNGGSRSRGRSLSSPIFIRRRNEASTEGPEPSSPKVTCMGQVRVTRSKQRLPTAKRAKTEQRPCLWFRNALFCNLCGFRKAKARSREPFWERLFVAFKFGFRRKVEAREKSSETESKGEDQTEEYADADEDEEDHEVREKVFVSRSPPKNALLLMRCKSEPSRASSLAYRFWGSPPSSLEVEHAQQIQKDPNHQKEEHKEQKEEQEKEDEDDEEEEVPMSRNEPNCRDSTAESRTDPENEEILLDYRERIESSSNQIRSFKLGEIRERKNRRVEIGEESGRGELARPLILPRCNSEPARLPEKLDSESWFWKRRLNHFEMPATTRF